MSASQVATLRWDGERLQLIDQRVLPMQTRYVACSSAGDVAAAIRDMVVRGAPAIGCAAAYGVALEKVHDVEDFKRLVHRTGDTDMAGGFGAEFGTRG